MTAWKSLFRETYFFKALYSKRTWVVLGILLVLSLWRGVLGQVLGFWVGIGFWWVVIELAVRFVPARHSGRAMTCAGD